jgi:glycosylphosphatidylinositol deacylase
MKYVLFVCLLQSTAVPSVWLSTDHLCSVWCKELVLVTVRTLFDIVNLTTKQVSKNVQERKFIFHYHMIQVFHTIT